MYMYSMILRTAESVLLILRSKCPENCPTVWYEPAVWRGRPLLHHWRDDIVSVATHGAGFRQRDKVPIRQHHNP